MTPKETVLKYFPKADDSFIEFVLFEKTGYPSFLRTASDLEKQVAKYKKAIDLGKDVCFGCGKIKKIKLGMCRPCESVLESVK